MTQSLLGHVLHVFNPCQLNALKVSEFLCNGWCCSYRIFSSSYKETNYVSFTCIKP